MEIILTPAISERLDNYCLNLGITQVEAIKYIVGQYLQNNYIAPTLTFPPPEIASRYPSISTEETRNQYLNLMARLVSSVGTCKCPNCTQHLDGDSLLKGECAKCGEKI